MIFVFLLLLLTPVFAAASEVDVPQAECPALFSSFRIQKAIRQDALRMDELTFTGLHRTSEEFVRDEIGFGIGCHVTMDDLQAAAQRLRNTNFFLTVAVEQEKISEEAVRVHFVFREKWTLTPVLRGGGGGGVTFFVMGLYDLNVFGAGIESGVQYEQYARAPGFTLWWRDPHVGSRDWKVSIELSQTTRPYFYLNPSDRTYHKPLALVRRGLLMGYRRFGSWEVGLGLEPLEKEFLSQDVTRVNEFAGFAKMNESGLNMRTLFRLNALNLDDFKVEGSRLELLSEVLFPIPSEGDQPPFLRLTANSLLFATVGNLHNLGLRVQGVWVSSGRLLQLSRLGGLDSVRGLRDGERIGRVTWLANGEYRYASVLTHTIVFQNVVFVDAGNGGIDFKNWPLPMAVSGGLGLRIGFRPLARLRLRADYALPVQGLDNQGSWVVGMQQYF
jgi:outer membrane protein assembly factor BamA